MLVVIIYGAFVVAVGFALHQDPALMLVAAALVPMWALRRIVCLSDSAHPLAQRHRGIHCPNAASTHRTGLLTRSAVG